MVSNLKPTYSTKIVPHTQRYSIHDSSIELRYKKNTTAATGIAPARHIAIRTGLGVGRDRAAFVNVCAFVEQQRSLDLLPLYDRTTTNPARAGPAGRTLARPRRPAAMGERQGCVPCTVLRPSTAQAANKDGESSAVEQPPDAADSPTPKPRAGPVKDLLVRWHKEVQGTMTCVPRRTAPTRAAQSDAPARKHSRLC